MTSPTKSIEVRRWNDPRRGCEFPMIDVSTHPEASDAARAISAIDVWEKSKDGSVKRVRMTESSAMSHAEALEIALDIARRRGVTAVYARNVCD